MRSDYTYLILGGGMAADAAARGIRELDESGTIGILSSDVDEPYARPPLTKQLWTDADYPRTSVPLNTASDTGAEIRLRSPVTALNAAQRAVTVGTETFTCEKLLIATGGEPKQMDLPQSDRVIYFRTFDDYRRLRHFAGRDIRIGVIGGGFIGTEIASSLAQQGSRVTLIYPEDTLGATIYPKKLASHVEQTFADRGVALRHGSRLRHGRASDGKVELTLDNGNAIDVDVAVAGVGIAPTTGFAEKSGLKISDGIVVDEYLQTSVPDVYAAGDVANYPDALLGRRRVEHVDNAEHMGRAAGRIMAGAHERFGYTPLFYSDIFDFGYEAVGVVDTSLEMIQDWHDPYRTGVVYYLRNERVVGVLLWNVWDQADAARDVIAQRRPQSDATLIGRIS